VVYRKETLSSFYQAPQPLSSTSFKFEPGLAPKKATLNRPQHLLQLACKVVRAAHGGIGVVSIDSDLMEHLTTGLPEQVAEDMWRSSLGNGLIRLVLQQTGLVNVADFTNASPGLQTVPHLSSLGPVLGMSLLCGGRCRAVLYLARTQGQPAFNQAEEETLLAFRPLLEQGNIFEETRLFAQLRLLNQVAQAAAGSLDLPRILSVALRELERYLPMHICSVWLLEEAESAEARSEEAKGEGRVASGDSPAPANHHSRPRPAPSLVLADTGAILNERAEKLGLVRGMRLDLNQSPFAACLGHGEAQYTDLVRPDGRINALMENLASRGANSSFAVPLGAGDQPVGVLQSICLRPTGFASEQIQFLYLVADLLGPAISNCQFYCRLRAAYEELRNTQNQLIQSEKMRALGELASGVAHDFNNSLCGVLGFLELMLTDQNLTTTNRSYLESARTCALDAAQTVRRVQDFARWQRNELAVQALDVNDLVRQTVELTRPKWDRVPHAHGNPIAVEVHTEATSWVVGSAAELREVLTNLVFNAVDAMPQGGHLTLRTWSTGSDVFLSVSDTGIGMNEATRQRLFEPFFTTKGERGTGLGLSVAFGIIQRYGGEIDVQSELGKGSTFSIRLPVPPENARGASSAPQNSATLNISNVSPPAQERVVSPLSATAKSLRVLVIEDEESIRRFLATGLTQLGHRPRVTNDAEEGLAAFHEEPFDLVLTDLGLPGLSGEEVARRVAQRSPTTPVVLLTGWSSQLHDEAQPLEGVTRILGKPISLSHLAATLASVCPP
jgi:signal transduction histidine kinase